MEAIAPTFVYRFSRLGIATGHPTQFVDLTDRIESLLAEAGMTVGLVNVQSQHTTAAIVVNEHEPELLGDFGAMLRSMAAPGARYRHDERALAGPDVGERPNGHSHCQALLLGSSVCLNVDGGRLVRGRWQRVFLVELDGPRPREVSIVMIGEGRP
jgi:secondary thiamine-phosphate synthase enzyme